MWAAVAMWAHTNRAGVELTVCREENVSRDSRKFAEGVGNAGDQTPGAKRIECSYRIFQSFQNYLVLGYFNWYLKDIEHTYLGLVHAVASANETWELKTRLQVLSQLQQQQREICIQDKHSKSSMLLCCGIWMETQPTCCQSMVSPRCANHQVVTCKKQPLFSIFNFIS